MTKVFIAGATGWAGSALARGVHAHPALTLAGGLSRTHDGGNLAGVLGLQGAAAIPAYGDIHAAIAECPFDTLVEYTKPAYAKGHIMAALDAGKNVLVGTSGLTNADYAEIEAAAHANQASVLAVGNFAITVVLLQKFAEIAAKYIPDFEIIDYAHERKIDAPSGTVRELAHRLSKVRTPNVHVPDDKIIGEAATRGANIDGVRVHALRLPGHVISVETVFGAKDERLTLRHDAGSGAEPYVAGALLAIEKLGTFKGLRRGLDSVMDW